MDALKGVLLLNPGRPGGRVEVLPECRIDGQVSAVRPLRLGPAQAYAVAVNDDSLRVIRPLPRRPGNRPG